MPTTITETVTTAGRHWDIRTTFSGAEVAIIRQRGAEREARNSAAVAAAVAKIEATAARTAIEAPKMRARAFLKHPGKLNALRWNLAQAEPTEGLRVVERLYADEPKVAQFPINIPLTNLAGARIAFRFLRRHERAADRAAMLAAE